MTDRKREDEWFQKFEEEMIRDARRRREEGAARKRSEADERLRQVHHLKCPRCGHDMKELELDRIMIDKCTQCEGVFFDRGELEDLLLQRAEARRGVFRKLLGLMP